MTNFVLKGDICCSDTPTRLQTHRDAYLVCTGGEVAGVFAELPEAYAGLPLTDYSGQLLLPGLTDLHIHAPQFPFRALGMDLELLDWLNTHTFPEEAKYAALDYAEKAYDALLRDLISGPNTRACIFATLHLPATRLLMDKLEASGLVTMVGKVNMDRNSPPELCEADAEVSLAATRQWLEETSGRYRNTSPILTPRFIPSCSDTLLQGLGQLQREFGLPVQSHLSENQSEIAWVRELCPTSRSYADAYAQFGLFSGDAPTIMAHCVWCGPEETALMRERGVYVAHCPQSNTNLSSGIAPVRRYLEQGVNVGLGSDVAGGCHTSIFRAMADAIQVSKLHWRLVEQQEAPLTVAEAFYLGTMGGGSFFGKVGTFRPGYAFDVVVLDDNRIGAASLALEDRLAKAVYLSDDRDIAAKYVAGAQVYTRE